MSKVTTMPATLARLTASLDEATAERARISRRIRALRSAIEAATAGDEVADLAELLASPSPRPALLEVAHEAPGAFDTTLGAGLPPGSAAVIPPPGPALDLTSVDVGRLGAMTPEQLDSLPFGVVTLDTFGRVVAYNDTESRLAGLPKDRVVGRNFFTEVAPCTRVREFEGRFRDFAEGRSRLALETFEFVFHFRHGVQRVVILISPARHRGRFHVSMIRR